MVNTEKYDGTAWSTAPNLGTARSGGMGTKNGTQDSATLSGGVESSPSTKIKVEEFTGETSALNFKTLTTS